MAQTPDDDIGYAGPDLTYTPSMGANLEVTRSAGSASGETYADANVLEDDLNKLLQELSEFRNDLEHQLVTKGVPLNDLDSRLQEANTLAWPSHLGEPKQYVSYRYYKYVELQNSTAAKVIQNSFKKAARDLGGTPALDMLTLVDSMNNEAVLIREFSKTYVKQLTDAAEHRTVELFQDWAQSALYHTGNLRNFFKKGITSKLPQDELETLSTTEARNSQAIFKIKLNTVNDKIDAAQEYLNKNFTQYAPKFYGNFLAPAMQFRLNVARKVFPLKGVLGEEVGRASTSLNANLQMLQGDQLRRNQIFDKQMTEVTNLLDEQGTYKNYIEQLAPIGRSLPAPSLIDIDYTEEEHEEFEYGNAEPASNTSIASPHNLLLGRDADDAHSQYFLKSGDKLEGDLTLEDEVRVDGIIPHLHAHTGEDGSALIEGTNIVGGTLPTSTIDTSEQPDRPTNLRLESLTSTTIPPGVSSLDAALLWEGDPNIQYEIQIVAL